MQLLEEDIQKELYKNVLHDTFPNLLEKESKSLAYYFIKLINYISIKFNMVRNGNIKPEFISQLRQNNYRDSRGILNLLLPHIDSNADKSKIKTFDDVYKEKHTGYTNLNKSPKYVYCNIQYSRCKRWNVNSGQQLEEIPFSWKYIDNNFKLLKDTIRRVSYKLFVNWMDILPEYSKDNYLNNIDLVKNTERLFMISSNPNDILNIMNVNNNSTYNGLCIEDIYSVIAIDMYENVKNIKWLIYGIVYDENLTEYQNVIETEFGVNFKSSAQWNSLENNERNKFDKIWKNMVDMYKSDKHIEKLSKIAYDHFIQTVVFFFNKYYNDLTNARKEGYKPFKYDKSKDDEDIVMSKDIILNSIETIPTKHLYKYIVQQLIKYKNINNFQNINTKESSIKYKEGYFNTINIELQRKMYYNIAKSLTHERKDGTYKYMGGNWESLTLEQKNIFLMRLLKGTDLGDRWFDISRYLKKIDPKINDLGTAHENIFNKFKKIFIHHIVDTLVKKGICSRFIPNSKITDKTKMNNPDDYKETIKKIDSIIFSKENIENKWNYCYYFLNNKYSDMKYNIKGTKLNYFEYMIKEQTWFTMFAMDWVSQIRFFHNYLNNRVMFVTGSTGVGKSTQVPKLLLYALKAIDFKLDGKIVCTQPRVPPTVENAKRIASELGVPIEEHNDSYREKTKTNNFYVQYKYKEGSHTTNDNITSLKIVTDGTLLQELKNPLLKKRIYNEKKEKYEYSNTNTYDIVIVDESHEHNANMDIILTQMKYTAYHNNTIKLVIISATMDSDEPIYRRFYRDINDNLKYPLSESNKENNFDRINVDRRMHIAPPNATTRFKINKYYTPDSTVEDIVSKIIKTSASGDILLFEPGSGEIKKRIDTLNKMLPSNIIALPYFSDMSEDKKSFIQSIHKNLPDYVYGKSVDFSLNIKDKFITDRVMRGTYKRVIIVATNIAEASITIPSLKFVIDTGTQKVALYDEISGNTELKLQPISRSSMEQREGRVGRVSSGDVYHMYKKGALDDIPTPYNISVQNISENIYSLLRETEHDNQKLVLEDSFNVYHYFTGNQKFTYVGVKDFYDYENNKEPHDYNRSGFSKDTLVDNKGTFYVIHPDELNLVRDIEGKIVNIIPKKGLEFNGESIKSFKLKSFWNQLQEKLMVVNTESIIIKTEFGKSLTTLKEQLKIDDIKHLIAYLFSIKYGVSDEMLKIIPILMMNKSIANWVNVYQKNGRYIFETDKFARLYKSEYGDLHGLLKCLNKLLNSLSNRVSVYKGHINIIRNKEFSNAKKIYINHKKGKIKYIGKELPYETYELLNKLDKADKLSYKDELTKREIDELIKNDSDIELFKKAIEENKEFIKDWCKFNYVNSDVIFSYINKLNRFKNSLYKKKHNLIDIDLNEKDYNINIEELLNYLDKFTKTTNNKEENITNALLHAYGSNVVRNIMGTQFYIPIANPLSENVRMIKGLTKYNSKPDTLMPKYSVYGYILHISKDSNNNYILVHRVTPKQIQQYVPFLYSPKRLSIILNHKYIQNMVYNDDNRNAIINYYKKTISKIKIELFNQYTSTIYEKLKGIDDKVKRTKDGRLKREDGKYLYKILQKNIMDNKKIIGN